MKCFFIICTFLFLQQSLIEARRLTTPDFPNGFFEKHKEGRIRYKFYCNQDFKLIGSNVIYLLPNREWSDLIPTCVPKNEIYNIPNGFFISNENIGKYIFFCDEGYNLLGPKIVDIEKPFYVIKPTCVPKVFIRTFPNGNFMLYENSKDITYSCNEGFHFKELNEISLNEPLSETILASLCEKDDVKNRTDAQNVNRIFVIQSQEVGEGELNETTDEDEEIEDNEKIDANGDNNVEEVTTETYEATTVLEPDQNEEVNSTEENKKIDEIVEKKKEVDENLDADKKIEGNEITDGVDKNEYEGTTEENETTTIRKE